ncbi:uncharacterized protein BJ171DRAFT_509817 [Polychytrium aggregatum]|uniref:uncharacterized protein n=1 Tax=Polychytrium aggregatum TaxID=110093 RepID=UPI0022FDD244|nr:uncharacterized protein BJ171DRAFT_509817 [Polychytrium aggregatum]KAI9203514.1 hypothetical protein BJ171DRAFT_509817 [Polychytrium aggregatum]
MASGPTANGPSKPSKEYSLSHQRIVLDFDFAQRSIHGLAELTITPTTVDLQAIKINCRQSKIDSITVNMVSAMFQYLDPASPVLPPNRYAASHHQEFRNSYTAAIQSGDEGEVMIFIPKEVKIAKIDPLSGESDAAGGGLCCFSNLVVKVKYTLREPQLGAFFVLPDSSAINSYPHMFVNNQACSARCWMPCVDRIQEKCTWEIELIVPSTVRDALGLAHSRHQYSIDVDADMVAVCAGDLIEQVQHPATPAKKIYFYSVMSNAVSASSILLAVGPFRAVRIQTWPRARSGSGSAAAAASDLATHSNGADDSAPSLESVHSGYSFCLPGKEHMADSTSSFLGNALEHFESYIGGSYPYMSYKQVFVDNAFNSITTGASISILSSHLLLPESIIDEVYETRLILVRGLASQWFGHYVSYKTWADVWLTIGLGGFVASLFMKKLHGNNEFKYRVAKDMNRVCALDINQPPLCPIGMFTLQNESTLIDPLLLVHYHPEDDPKSVRSELIMLKSPLIFYMMDRRMGKGVLQKLINKLMISAMSGELTSGCSTHHFLKMARKLSGKLELKAFSEQWIYGSGCPKFVFSYSFNRKRMMVEVKFRQENTNAAMMGHTMKFSGPFTIRIHEPSGTFDTEVQIEDIEKQFDVQYHTKYKRIRRKVPTTTGTKKGKKTGNPGGADKGDENDDGEGDLMDVDEEGDWKDDENDGLLDWRDPDADRLTFEWIRLDPDNDWLCSKVYEQSDFMWAAQLQKDRDVIAQLEAIDALYFLPSLGTSTTLSGVIQDKSYFYRVRVEAALALVQCATAELDWAGLNNLLKLYREEFCYPIADKTISIPKPNSFTRIQDYFVKKALVIALSRIRNDEEHSPSAVRRFLLSILKFNNNTGNEFSDCYFVSSVISSIGSAFLPTSITRGFPRKEQPLVQLDKFTLQSVMPSGAIVEEFDIPELLADPKHIGAPVPTADAKARKPAHGGTDDDSDRALFDEALLEIKRYLSVDKFLPSYHNCVTVACLEAMTKWMLAGISPMDIGVFLPYSCHGNFRQVRITAIDSILVVNGILQPEITMYLINLCRYDPDPQIRYHTAKAMGAYISVAYGQLAHASGKTKKPLGGDQDATARGKYIAIAAFRAPFRTEHRDCGA